MSIRWRRYFPACKGKRADGDRYGKVEKDGVSPATAGIDLSALRSILSMAMREGLLNKNPCDRIKGLRHFTKTERREVIPISDTL